MRYSIAVLLLAGMVGCGDFEEAMNAEREPAAPAGVLPVDQMDGDIDNMTSRMHGWMHSLAKYGR